MRSRVAAPPPADMNAPVGQDEVRRNNLARVLRRLHLGGSASRSDLVAITGLNRSTVGALVTELTDAGLVSEQSGATGTVGRPSLVVIPEPESAFVIALDFRVDRVVAAAIGLGGTTLARREHRHGRSGYGPDAAVPQMSAIASDLLEAVPEGATWVGVGVGVPGIVDGSTGVVKLAPNLEWVDVPLGELMRASLAELLGDVPPVVIGNDADLGALAEHTRGAAVGCENVIYLSGEVGIGGGIVLDGHVLTGAGGFGGEVGHMIVNPSGALCHCGSSGCWETVIGRDAVLVSAGRPSENDDISHLLQAADAGDREARAALDDFGAWLGIGLRNLVNIFNPEVIVLGGHLGVLLPSVVDAMDARLRQSIAASLEQVHVVPAALGSDSTLTGATEAAFAALLANPLGTLEQSSTLVAS